VPVGPAHPYHLVLHRLAFIQGARPRPHPVPAAAVTCLTHLSGDTMTEHADLIPDLDSEDAFEVQMRGYSRRQVNEFVARSRSQTRDLEERLSRSLDEVERLRLELSASRQKAEDSKPAYEEVSERMGQILKLADDEARAQKARALEEIAKLRADAKQETDRFKAEAREQTERMLAAAQEQAENAIASARAEADKTRNSARAEAEHTVSEAQKKSESAVAAAKAQAKQMLDEATARATAIHDGAERRLNLLVARHTETLRRLTEVRDVVTNLVAGEAARGSLEDEVARSVSSAISGSGGTGAGAGTRPAGPAEGRHAPSAAPGSQAAQAGRASTRGALPDDQERRAKTQAPERMGLDSGNGVAESAAGPARAGQRVGPAAGDRAERAGDPSRSAKADSPVAPRPAANESADTAE
jgi:cell division septum initiation protein DivIVA